jgi:hypothetical protein
VPNTAHILQFTLCELWSRTYTKYLQHRIFILQYSTDRIRAAIRDISSIQCAFYSKLGAKYSAHLPVCALWAVVPSIYKLQLRIFRLQYSAEVVCAAIGDISSIQCALCCKLDDKYSAHLQVYAVWTVVPPICNVVTALHIQALIFNWIYLCCYWRYVNNSVRLILQTWCQIQRTTSSLRYLNCGPGHIQCTYSSEYLGFNIQL